MGSGRPEMGSTVKFSSVCRIFRTQAVFRDAGKSKRSVLPPAIVHSA